MVVAGVPRSLAPLALAQGRVRRPVAVLSFQVLVTQGHEVRRRVVGDTGVGAVGPASLPGAGPGPLCLPGPVPDPVPRRLSVPALSPLGGHLTPALRRRRLVARARSHAPYNARRAPRYGSRTSVIVVVGQKFCLTLPFLHCFIRRR